MSAETPAAPVAPPAADEPSSLRLILTMAIAGLLAGLVLVGAHLWTKPLIDQNRWDAIQRAVVTVLPGTTSTRTWVLRDGKLAAYDGPQGQLPDEEAVYSGHTTDGGLIGFAVPAQGPGYQDTVSVLYGFDPAKQRIIGLVILESKETPGLGDRIDDDPQFHAGFASLAITPPIQAVRDGRDAPNEVDIISGATISSEAVVNMLNASAAEWAPRLKLPDGGP